MLDYVNEAFFDVFSLNGNGIGNGNNVTTRVVYIDSLGGVTVLTFMQQVVLLLLVVFSYKFCSQCV